MKRIASKMLWTTALLAVAMVAQVAMAQLEGGRPPRGPEGPGGPGGPGGRGMPPTSVRLAGNPAVQDALKLNDEQKKKVESIHQDLLEQVRKAFGERQGTGDFQKMREQMREQMEKHLDDAVTKLKGVLNEDQQKQLAGIAIKVNDARALNDPLVASELKLTDEQKKKLADIRQKAMGEFRGGRSRTEGRPSREDRRERGGQLQEGRGEAQKEFLAVLTPEQKKDFEALKSAAGDIDVSKLRGPEGAGRPGARERRGEGGRQRDRERPTSKSAEKSSTN